MQARVTKYSRWTGANIVHDATHNVGDDSDSAQKPRKRRREGIHRNTNQGSSPQTRRAYVPDRASPPPPLTGAGKSPPPSDARAILPHTSHIPALLRVARQGERAARTSVRCALSAGARLEREYAAAARDSGVPVRSAARERGGKASAQAGRGGRGGIRTRSQPQWCATSALASSSPWTWTSRRRRPCCAASRGSCACSGSAGRGRACARRPARSSRPRTRTSAPCCARTQCAL